MTQPTTEKCMNSQERLHHVVQCLSQSCPWTKSIKAKEMLSWLKSEVLELEEELELWDASQQSMMSNRRQELISEMGDILFDVLMLEMILKRDYYHDNNKEEAWLHACEKIERRTPYMKEWGDGVSIANTAEEATELWLAAKKKEKQQNQTQDLVDHHSDSSMDPTKKASPILSFFKKPLFLPGRIISNNLLCSYPHRQNHNYNIMLSSAVGFFAGALVTKCFFSSSSNHIK